jgi:hypothetical protein
MKFEIKNLHSNTWYVLDFYHKVIILAPYPTKGLAEQNHKGKTILKGSAIKTDPTLTDFEVLIFDDYMWKKGYVLVSHQTNEKVSMYQRKDIFTLETLKNLVKNYWYLNSDFQYKCIFCNGITPPNVVGVNQNGIIHLEKCQLEPIKRLVEEGLEK